MVATGGVARSDDIDRAAHSRTRPRMTERADLVTSLLAVWLIGGLFLDGWAHLNRPEEETFFTPWHGVLYSGFFVMALWVAWSVFRFHKEGGRSWRDSVPVGYGLGVAGVALFMVGGVGDLIWHEIFGIEVSIEALVSPSHLALFVGLFLIVSSPLRAAWRSGEGPGSFGAFLPELISMTIVVLVATFVFQYIVIYQLPGTMRLSVDDFARRFGDIPTGPPLIRDVGIEGWERTSTIRGLSSILVTNLLMMAPMLMLLRRWRKPPFGYSTFLFVVLAVGASALRQFQLPVLLIAPVVAGLVADFLIHRWDPNPENPTAFRMVPTITSFVMWISFFLIYEIAYGVGWGVELWAGITFLAGLEGFAVGLLVLPPSIPPSAYVKPARR